MDRRTFIASLTGGAVLAGTLGTTAAMAAPTEMQWYGYGYGPRRRRHWGGRPYGFYGPRPWGPPPRWRRRCWINRWGERVCRF